MGFTSCVFIYRTQSFEEVSIRFCQRLFLALTTMSTEEFENLPHQDVCVIMDCVHERLCVTLRSIIVWFAICQTLNKKILFDIGKSKTKLHFCSCRRILGIILTIVIIIKIISCYIAEYKHCRSHTSKLYTYAAVAAAIYHTDDGKSAFCYSWTRICLHSSSC